MTQRNATHKKRTRVGPALLLSPCRFSVRHATTSMERGDKISNREMPAPNTLSQMINYATESLIEIDPHSAVPLQFLFLALPLCACTSMAQPVGSFLGGFRTVVVVAAMSVSGQSVPRSARELEPFVHGLSVQSVPADLTETSSGPYVRQSAPLTCLCSL